MSVYTLQGSPNKKQCRIEAYRTNSQRCVYDTLHIQITTDILLIARIFLLRNSQNIRPYYMLNHRIRCMYPTNKQSNSTLNSKASVLNTKLTNKSLLLKSLLLWVHLLQRLIRNCLDILTVRKY